MKKTDLSEADVCYRFVTPAIEKAGWKPTQIRMEYPFTAGEIVVRRKVIARGKRKRADYLLELRPGLPIAVVEAKKATFVVGAGMQQAQGYADTLKVPFVFSTNGDGFLFHDRSGASEVIETKLSLNEFPTPEELWRRYQFWNDTKDASETHQDALGRSNFYQPEKAPRYYQQIAINQVLEAIAKGQKRCLLTMATGTGKTYTAFNIIWRLWKSGAIKRTLFLADRNILIDQAIINDFAPFGGAMKKLSRKLVDRQSGRVDTSYEIYMALYQAISKGEGREAIYDKFPPDFFDLIVVDECHRGSARNDSTWREILEYYEPATQLGMTATPKETEDVSNTDYFGEPVYSYSLKQGIEDGFLAPYKVVRIDLEIEMEGWEPDADDEPTQVPEGIDRTIIIPERTRVVAEKITEFLHGTNPMHKTIVFCENIKHAERMRQALVNHPLNRKHVLKNSKYVMRITGDEELGKEQLENFINPKKEYPVIATTSKLMTTGIDAQTCHLIVLDRTINSMTEFKQIVGRGTRLRPDYGKHFFTIMDFRGSTRHFADDKWDGPAIQIYEPKSTEGGDIVPPEQELPEHEDNELEEILVDRRHEVDASALGFAESGDVEANSSPSAQAPNQNKAKVTAHTRATEYCGPDGRPLEVPLREHTQSIVVWEYRSLEEFVKQWNSAESKADFIKDLLRHGVMLNLLRDLLGSEYGAFDLICHAAFDQPLKTRRDRAEEAKKVPAFTKHSTQVQGVLSALLEKYVEQGVDSVEDMGILTVEPLNSLGTRVEIVVGMFGGVEKYKQALHEIKEGLYNVP